MTLGFANLDTECLIVTSRECQIAIGLDRKFSSAEIDVHRIVVPFFTYKAFSGLLYQILSG